MPKRADVTPAQEQLLNRARDIAEARVRIEDEYLSVIMRCLDAGITKAEIARTVGVTGESIRKLEQRHGR